MKIDVEKETEDILREHALAVGRESPERAPAELDREFGQSYAGAQIQL